MYEDECFFCFPFSPSPFLQEFCITDRGSHGPIDLPHSQLTCGILFQWNFYCCMTYASVSEKYASSMRRKICLCPFSLCCNSDCLGLHWSFPLKSVHGLTVVLDLLKRLCVILGGLLAWSWKTEWIYPNRMKLSKLCYQCKQETVDWSQWSSWQKPYLDTL